MEKVGGKLNLQCDFDCRNLPISKPGFYRLPGYMVHSHRKGKCSYEDIMNQLVWNNNYTLSDGKSLYHAFFHNTFGISKVGDLVSKDNIFLGNGKTLNSKLTPSLYFLLLGVVSAIPNEWRSTIKGKVFMLNSSPPPRILSLKIRFKCQ